MILRKLTLINFRVFSGEHSIDLQPRKSGVFAKPLILFGGLNGAGKTSILTAIRLLLMGRKALSTIVSNKDYSAHLSQQINNRALKEDSSTKAHIALEFSHTHQGKHCIYKVSRTWGEDGRELLSLQRNDMDVPELNAEQVQSLLSEMIPPGIGDLFFFDGEKIAELAEDDTGVYLKEAVQKLLGIDVINRLSDDLNIYLKQFTKDKVEQSTLALISDLEGEKAHYYNKADKAREQAERLNPKLAEIRKAIQYLESSVQQRGGAWAKTKTDEKARLDSLVKETHQLQSSILSELEGAFPLSLAPTAISALFAQLRLEKESKESQAFNSKLNEHSEKLVEQLAHSLQVNKDDIGRTFSTYLTSLSNEQHAQPIHLDISDSDFYRLEALKADADVARQNVAHLSQQLHDTQEELESLSINIQRAPDEAELASLYEKLREHDKEQTRVKDQYKTHLLDAKTNMTRALDAAKRLEKLFAQQRSEETVLKAASRVSATQDVLEVFSKRLTELRVHQLETLFVKAYRKLARKEDFKLAAKIDPATFDVSLVDQEGVEINRKSLSAGEKQIFAFAILEALGKLSGKILPVVVDTPLGRLDSKHRDKLIQHYFPEAGEQVILLSTDTEVDETFYSILSSKISHAFEISFDETTRSSTISEGYFWQPQQLKLEAV